jgi:hypothetical protein
MSTNFNVQYNIPRVQVQLPGKQNRLTDGEFRITPSMTEPVKFLFGNQDGVAIGLIPFTVHFLVWERSFIEYDDIGVGQSQVLLNKRIQVDDPYSGEVEMVLSSEETMLIGNHASGQSLNWSLFMVNDAGEVFPAQVSNSGGRVGALKVDLVGGMPIAELIKAPLT